MKKILLTSLVLILISFTAFAEITLPHTGIVLNEVPSNGRWLDNNLTETLRKNIPSFIVKIEDEVLLNSYRYPEPPEFDDDGFFFVLSEFSGMKFVFSWSAVRVMAFKNTRNEVENAYKSRIAEMGGSDLKITKKDYNSKTGQYFYEYTWKDKDGNRVNGRSYGGYDNRETLITLTVEYRREKGKVKAEKVLKEFKEKLNIEYPINL